MSYINGVGYPIISTVNNHAMVHTAGDVTWYGDAIKVSRESCDAPEEAHKHWVKEQGVCTNEGPRARLSMMLYSLRKEASVLLCKAVQGNVWVLLLNCRLTIMHILHWNLQILHILHILQILHILHNVHKFIFSTRIDDGDQIDDLEVIDHRTGNRVPLRAYLWYQSVPDSQPIVSRH